MLNNFLTLSDSLVSLSLIWDGGTILVLTSQGSCGKLINTQQPKDDVAPASSTDTEVLVPCCRVSRPRANSWGKMKGKIIGQYIMIHWDNVNSYSRYSRLGNTENENWICSVWATSCWTHYTLESMLTSLLSPLGQNRNLLLRRTWFFCCCCVRKSLFVLFSTTFFNPLIHSFHEIVASSLYFSKNGTLFKHIPNLLCFMLIDKISPHRPAHLEYPGRGWGGWPRFGNQQTSPQTAEMSLPLI